MASNLGVLGTACIVPAADYMYGIFVTDAMMAEPEGGQYYPTFRSIASVTQFAMSSVRLATFTIRGYIMYNNDKVVQTSKHLISPLTTDTNSNLPKFMTMDTFANPSAIYIFPNDGSWWYLTSPYLTRVQFIIRADQPPMIQIEGVSKEAYPQSKTTTTPSDFLADIQSALMINAARCNLQIYDADATPAGYATLRAVSAVFTIERPPAPLYALGTIVTSDPYLNSNYLDRRFLHQADGGVSWEQARLDAVFEHRKSFTAVGGVTDWYKNAYSNANNYLYISATHRTLGTPPSDTQLGFKFGPPIMGIGRREHTLNVPRVFYNMTFFTSSLTPFVAFSP